MSAVLLDADTIWTAQDAIQAGRSWSWGNMSAVSLGRRLVAKPHITDPRKQTIDVWVVTTIGLGRMSGSSPLE